MSGLSSNDVYNLGNARGTFNEMVIKERLRHLEKWGVQAHSLDEWTTILTEELGEFAQAVNDIRIKTHQDDFEGAEEAVQRAIKELVETAAVASAIFEEYFVVSKESTDEGSSSI